MLLETDLLEALTTELDDLTDELTDELTDDLTLSDKFDEDVSDTLCLTLSDKLFSAFATKLD